MNVDEAVRRHREKRRRKDASIGDDDSDVAAARTNLAEEIFSPDLRRLQQRDPELGSALRDGGLVHLHSTSRGTIGLRHDHDDVMRRGGDRVERGNGELGSTEISDSQDRIS